MQSLIYTKLISIKFNLILQPTKSKSTTSEKDMISSLKEENTMVSMSKSEFFFQ